MFVWSQTLGEVDSTGVDSIDLWSDTTMVFVDTLPPRPNIFDSLPYIRVYQDSVILSLLQDKVYGKSQHTEVMGYRIQVFSSNRQPGAKEEAIELQKKLTRTLPVTIYIQYISPFWKVRAGDFLTRDEANLFMSLLLSKYPALKADTYIVKDQINVRL